jgi:superfamily II DNA/RNA helicase
MGLNELQTLLRQATQRQDFSLAGKLSDEIFARLYDDTNLTPEERRVLKRRMSWRGLGAAPWLVERLDSLNYTFPTTIQMQTLQAVNSILNATDDALAELSLEERLTRFMTPEENMGIVVSGSTGSGKTISFLVPLLSTLSDSLFARQRIRVGAEEDVGSGDLLERISVVTSPVIRSKSRQNIRGSSVIATGASLATLGQSGKDVKSPLALIVVPTRELGIQTAMLLYELVGGSIKNDPTDIRGKANMFKYKGPKGVRIGCVLEDDEASFGLKLQTDVAITMPQYLGKLIDDGDLIPSKLRVIIFDEADLALEETKPEDLKSLFEEDNDEREYNRLTFLVGASVTESLGSMAIRTKMLPEGKSYIATATRNGPLLPDREASDESAKSTTADAKAASLQDLRVCLDPGLRHQRVRVGNETGLLVLARMLRKELENYDTRRKENPNLQRPRVVVFFPNEAMAKKSIEPLRDALWGEHRVCVLLPKTGVQPLQMMEDFKKNETTVMLATPNSVRGLDFPAVSHVYTLYLPIEDPREYVHLAGRVGRVGQMGSVQGGGGQVISVLKDQDASKMDVLASELGFEFTDVVVNQDEDLFARTAEGEVDLDSVDVEKMRRYLEDTISLLSRTEDDEDYTSSSSTTVDVEFEEDEFDDPIGISASDDCDDGDDGDAAVPDWQ